MMKIITRICVIFLLAAGVYFLRGSDEPTTVQEDKDIISGEEVEEKDSPKQETVVLDFESKQKTPKNVSQKKIVSDKTQTPSSQINEEEKEETTDQTDTSSAYLVKVFLYEWELDISDSTLPAGKILLEVHNNGRFSHDLAIKGGQYFGNIPPKTKQRFEVYLNAGSYELYSPKKVDQMYNIGETIVVE